MSEKRGKFGKYLPTRWLEVYQSSHEDEELATMADSLRLHDALIAEALKRAESYQPDLLWERFLELFKETRKAYADSQLQTLDRLFGIDWPELLHEATLERQTRQEISGLLAERATMVSAHARAVQASDRFMPYSEVMRIMAVVATAVQENVQSASERMAVLRALREAAERSTASGEGVAN